MTVADHLTALMSAQFLPEAAETGTAPEWVHLLPAGENGTIRTDDKRGPYHVSDAEEIIALSFAGDDRLPIDENHATDLAAPKGQPAPARGWIVAMEARDDGIWGKVEWTAEGEQLVASRAYRGISPVIFHDESKTIRMIGRASLVNKPNLRGMASLHQQETGMDFRAKLIEMLGIAGTATDDEIAEAMRSYKSGKGSSAAMQSAMTDIGTALGLNADADTTAIVAAAQAAGAAGDKDGLIAELQSSVKDLSSQIASLTEGKALQAAEDFFEKAVSEKRAGFGPQSRDHWITMHQANPDAAVAAMEAAPKLTRTHTKEDPPDKGGTTTALNASQSQIATQLGLDPETYQKSLQSYEETA
ncbi:phage protease [Roseobacter sp. S98]|uniref:phage protease n=1 Tax=Roseobacter algicola (ex Choi et al. 2025) (nom. illeg.) TaxID=3092138 RepID=UPI0035C68B0D